MQIIDFSQLDGLNERDRLEAISLIGDGTDLNGKGEFGIAVGDRLYHVKHADGKSTVRFATLLALELGSVDRCLIALPADPTTWDAAAEEYRAYTGHRHDNGLDPIGTLRTLRRASVDSPLHVMIGRTGIALLCREQGSWLLAHCRFELLKHGAPLTPGSAPDLIDFSEDRFPDGDIEAALRAVEAESADDVMLSPEILEIGTGFYTALLCIERANTLSRHAPDPQAVAAAAHNVVMPLE